MDSRYELQDGDFGSVLTVLLAVVALSLIGKLLAILGILTEKNSVTLAKITGVICGVAYGTYMSTCCALKGPPWVMFLSGGTLVGLISFGVACFAFVTVAPKNNDSK